MDQEAATFFFGLNADMRIVGGTGGTPPELRVGK
jgi:hypothetical protein